MSEDTKHRANGEGSIFRYRDGWRGEVSWFDRSGKRHRKTVSGKTKTAVRQSLTAVVKDLDDGIKPLPGGTVAAYLTAWLASRQRQRPSTLRQYEQAIRLYLIPALGHIELRELEPRHVEAMTKALTDSGRSPQTAALARATLRKALNDALKAELVRRNVATLAEAPVQTARSLQVGRDYLDADQLRTLLASVRLHPLGPLVTILATTGLRVGEALGLQWSDVCDGQLTVRRSLARARDGGYELAAPKTDTSRRTIRLPQAAQAALERQRALQTTYREVAGSRWQDRDNLVFTTSIGTHLDAPTVNRHFHAMLDAAGLPSIPVHGLRHSAATLMLANGVPLKTVSVRLGHSTIVVTADRYAGVTPQMDDDAADVTDRALGGLG
jgi:integrase